jgi:hypothetical protein
MIKLTIDPQVLTKLQQAFPTPANSASKALAKYVTALEGLLLHAVQHGIAPAQRKLGLYQIPLHDLANKGGRIGPNKLRVHKWLKDEQLELVKTVEKGSKFTGEYSTVKLSSLVTLDDRMTVSGAAISQIKTDRELDCYLTGEETDSRAVFQHLYPGLDPCSLSGAEVGFDFVPVDIKSLNAFVHWLGAGAEFGTKEKRQQILNHAKLVLAVSSINGAWFPQRIKRSPFGRTYYEGISVQNVHKELRRAMLGNCWEYDMRSSVVAWKMGYARDLLLQAKTEADVRLYFPATTLYLEDKSDFMSTVRYFTFAGNESLTKDFQMGLIKQALTAISFGAKSTGSGWTDSSGGWKNPALVDILKNQSERDLFLADPTVKSFIEEQRALDDFIFGLVKVNCPELLVLDCLQTASGRVSKSKVLAYMYQHAETNAMDLICSVAAQYGHIPLARVHDAVFFKSRLGPDLKQLLEFKLQDETHNKYWHLSPKQIKRYQPVSLDAAHDELLHRQRIADEERRAIDYSSTFAHLEVMLD